MTKKAKTVAFVKEFEYVVTMTDQIQKPKEMDKQKKEMLAKALRENLLRRKAWQRAQEDKKDEKK